jgi:hypothetical protein
MPERYRVIKAHDPEFPEPWTVGKGERLRFERRETESAGWIWCTDDAGEDRWVPENWVEIEGDSCVTKRDYNSTELGVEVGEALTVEFEGSGWAWVTKESGESGWVPLVNLGTATRESTRVENVTE